TPGATSAISEKRTTPAVCSDLPVTARTVAGTFSRRSVRLVAVTMISFDERSPPAAALGGGAAGGGAAGGSWAKAAECHAIVLARAVAIRRCEFLRLRIMTTPISQFLHRS